MRASAPTSTIFTSIPSGAAPDWAASLLGAAMRQVAERGEARAYLWVFDGNTRAIEFYRRLGGEIVEGGFEEIDGLTIPQSRIVWRDTLRLAEACA